MIKRNGQRIAAIAMTVALMGQNVSPIFSLESLKGIETVTSENEAKAEELAPQDQYEETEKSELEETEFEESSETEIEKSETEEIKSKEVQAIEEAADKTNTDKATIDFKVLATSDLHANLMNYDYYTGSETNNSGLVKAATVIKEQKEQANKSKKSSVDNVLLVDNGDTIQGTPLANLYAIKQPVKPGQKYPVYEALESLGYDMTL